MTTDRRVAGKPRPFLSLCKQIIKRSFPISVVSIRSVDKLAVKVQFVCKCSEVVWHIFAGTVSSMEESSWVRHTQATYPEMFSESRTTSWAGCLTPWTWERWEGDIKRFPSLTPGASSSGDASRVPNSRPPTKKAEYIFLWHVFTFWLDYNIILFDCFKLFVNCNQTNFVLYVKALCWMNLILFGQPLKCMINAY